MFVITDIEKLFLFFTYHDNHIIHGSLILFFLDYESQKINSVDHVSRETPLRPLYKARVKKLNPQISQAIFGLIQVQNRSKTVVCEWCDQFSLIIAQEAGTLLKKIGHQVILPIFRVERYIKVKQNCFCIVALNF